METFDYKRKRSGVATIGTLAIGGDHPIALQSMTNTSTLDTQTSVEQIIRIADRGAHLVRLTAQGIKEANNLEVIRAALFEKGITIPLSADIHFNAKVAFEAAKYVEKVRINPGNFRNLCPEKSLEEVLVPLIELCKEKKVALRIGVNHGSLANRIVEKYGDTPLGMAMSCMEFLLICKKEHFENVVVSMKSSNVRVMVQSVRLVTQLMTEAGVNYPLHLGVTEAGAGEDGRIKSAVGIGGLLSEGYGDTIRVSLSEDPEDEIPVAKHLVEHLQTYLHQPSIAGDPSAMPLPQVQVFNRRASRSVLSIGNQQAPIIIADALHADWEEQDLETPPDFLYCGLRLQQQAVSIPQLLHHTIYTGLENTYPVYEVDTLENSVNTTLPSLSSVPKFIQVQLHEITPQLVAQLSEGNWVILFQSTHAYPLGEIKAALSLLNSTQCPIIIQRDYAKLNLEAFQLNPSMDLGIVMLDGLIDGLHLRSETLSPAQVIATQFGLLQAARLRTTKTEYISCPGCGRTHFALQKVVAEVKEATSHLKGLKIAVMGCIVNGPGEMADADYGYVGAAPNKISIYKGHTCIEKNIEEAQAVTRLIALIKEHGDWK